MRDTAARKADTMAVLEKQGHMWLATAHDGSPHVIGVSAWWIGDEIVVTTIGSSRTAANLQAGAKARLVAGSPDDAVVILATVVGSSPAAADAASAEGFQAAMGWDPREAGDGWVFFRLQPTR